MSRGLDTAAKHKYTNAVGWWADRRSPVCRNPFRPVVPVPHRGNCHPYSASAMLHTPDYLAARRAQASNRLKSATILWLRKLEDHGISAPRYLFDKYPHVLDKIAAAWGSAPAMTELMEKDLLIDNRGGREGFPFHVLGEIQGLYNAHKARYTIGEPLPRGWDAVVLRRRETQ